MTKREMELELNKLLGLRGFAWGMRMDRLRKVYYAVLERCGNGNQQ